MRLQKKKKSIGLAEWTGSEHFESVKVWRCAKHAKWIEELFWRKSW